MTIRNMTLADLQLVLHWAASEGWNPGLDDAAAFMAADPQGFFIKEIKGVPVAAISVVNHTDHFAFLGLYICHPDHRGQGHGWDIWQAGMAHAGSRTVGLDGVPDQQANYAKSGFIYASRTIRYEGNLSAGQAIDVAPSTTKLLAVDKVATGLKRVGFTSDWFADTAHRKTVAHGDGYATFRKCQDGTKIGPLYANTDAKARALLAACPWDGPVYIDVPQECTALTALVTQMGFAPVFETARMYKGAPPDAKPPAFHAIATMELG
ncbi:GNAT family N-acetyltransferase [Loktanella agnita]|uniref:GNAT family N-acetyltransferase n=1 Tax=Loktanella agnita TaxID=287097 RepID=UPI0039873BC5